MLFSTSGLTATWYVLTCQCSKFYTGKLLKAFTIDSKPPFLGFHFLGYVFHEMLDLNALNILCKTQNSRFALHSKMLL